MNAVRTAVHLVETLANLLIAAGRISFAELEFVADWVDTNFGTLLSDLASNRWMELVSAGRRH